MSSPLPYLVRMLVFLAGVAGLVYVLHEDLFRIFEHTPQLDAVILGVLVLGIFFVFRQVIILWPEVSWMRRYRNREADAPVPPSDSVNLLAPLAAMLGEAHDRIRLSPTATRAVLDGIATRLDERRELARYMIGLLIFLGLLGTFWGLLQTIGAVADAINSLQVSAGDAMQMFAKLKTSIEGPLKGMSTAFGASLFGLSGSLVLGFLELQASQAQGRFHIELEEWLARATSLSTSSLPPGVAQSVPAYVEALLERNTEGVDGLMRSIHRIEESRQAAAAGNATLVERLAALAETMRAQQTLLARFTELSIELRTALGRLSERATDDAADREAADAHRRAVEGHLARLVEESLRTRGSLAAEIAKASDAHREALEVRIAELGAQAAAHRQQIAADLEQLSQNNASGQAQLNAELKRAIARLNDHSAADADREAMANLQHSVEGQLAHVVDESRRARAALAEELRSAVTDLADRFADVDREAMALHRRNIEAHLARLVEDTETNRTALAEEIRGEIRLLARTIARARQAEPEPVQEQPMGN
jgi:hypothetical protein